MKKTVWKQPDGAGGYEEIYHETSADMVVHGDKNVAQILDDSPVISDFMQSLLQTKDAKSARKILSVNKEILFDECGRHWIFAGNPVLSNYHAKFNNALKLNGSTYCAINSKIALGGQDFAIECFFAADSVADRQILFSLGDASDYIATQIYDGKIDFITRISGVNNEGFSQEIVNAGQIYHLLTAYHDGVLSAFLDGENVLTLNIGVLERRDWNIFIGNHSGYSLYFTGAISEFRLSDGTAREGFTPPVEPFDLDEFTLSLLHFD